VVDKFEVVLEAVLVELLGGVASDREDIVYVIFVILCE